MHLGKHNLIEKNNTSAIQLEQNGKHSSTQQTKHIDIRYFYVTDKVKDGTVEVTYKKDYWYAQQLPDQIFDW